MTFRARTPVAAILCLASSHYALAEVQTDPLQKEIVRIGGELATRTAEGRFYQQVEGTSLEGVPRAPTWAIRQTELTISGLKQDPRFLEFYWEAAKAELASTEDAVSNSQKTFFLGDSVLVHFRDVGRPKGIIRKTSNEDFRSSRGVWETVFDLDALAKTQGGEFRYYDLKCLEGSDRCLLLLDLGNAKFRVREIDLKTKSLVPGGFDFEGPTWRVVTIEWRDGNSLYIIGGTGDDWLSKPREMTSLRLWARGTNASAAKQVLRTGATDEELRAAGPKATPYSIRAMPLRMENGTGLFVFDRGVNGGQNLRPFILSASIINPAGKIVSVSPHLSANMLAPVGIMNGNFIYWEFDPHAQTGSISGLCSVPLDQLSFASRCDQIIKPPSGQVLSLTSISRNSIIIALEGGVTQTLKRLILKNGAWQEAQIDIPEPSNVRAYKSIPNNGFFYVAVETLTAPPATYEINMSNGTATRVAGDRNGESSLYRSETKSIRAADGHTIYFYVVSGQTPSRRPMPTILTAYPNMPALLPSYDRLLLDLWVKRGGAFVQIANMRGYGLEGADRQRGYEDVATVARYLIEQGLTAPSKLGFEGHSMGGLTSGIMFNQYQKLFNAFVIGNPMLDIMTTRSPETPWAQSTSEKRFGDFKDPVNQAYLRRTSPIQNIRRIRHSPPPFIATSTNDHDVPAEDARIFARRLQLMGMSFYFYESPDGRHWTCGSPQECAQYNALKYTYFAQRLMDQRRK